MLSLNQIKMQTFPTAGRGAYRSADVDAFMQQVYVSFTELMSENTMMKKKFASLSSIIDEYNAGKNAIATALVKAQAVADETMLTANQDAKTIVDDAKEEAKAILDESQSKADAYAREKQEAADANYARSEQELARVMAEVKAQSDAYMVQINDQANALIADANEKAATIVGAAYKDAKVAKEKTEEIIERANVEIETTRNEILSFKESALQMLSQLLPLIEGIDLNGYAVADLAAETEIPQMEANEETAPVFELKEDFEAEAEAEPDTEQEAVAEPEPEEAPAPEEAPVEAEPEAETPSFTDKDDLIAQISSIIKDVEPEAAEEPQPSLFDLPVAPEMPVYHPYEPQVDEPKTELIVDADAEEENAEATEEIEDAPAYDFEEIETEPEEDTLPFDEEEADEEDDADDDEDEEDDDDDDAPHDPFKFRLTKTFDIFDDDND